MSSTSTSSPSISTMSFTANLLPAPACLVTSLSTLYLFTIWSYDGVDPIFLNKSVPFLSSLLLLNSGRRSRFPQVSIPLAISITLAFWRSLPIRKATSTCNSFQSCCSATNLKTKQYLKMTRLIS